MRRFYVELIRPSQYDDEGFVIQWKQAYTPANSLACLHGLIQHLDEHNALGGDVGITVTSYDESHVRIPIQSIVDRFNEPESTGLVALVGVQTTQYPRALDLARQFRERGVAVAIGGFHVSGCVAMLPGLDSSLTQAMDMGVSLFIGEAEDRLLDVLRDAMEGSLKPIYNNAGALPNLESQPVPFLPGPLVKAYADSVCTCDAGRGCPYRCNFCSIINVQGRRSRSRSADDIEQMARLNAQQGVNRLFITDDNFARNRNWESILDRLISLRQQGVKFNLTLQVDTLCHRISGFIEKAAQAGCSSVFIGLETINPKSLRLADKTQNRIAEYQALMKAWRSFGVMTYAGYIIGFPDDTPESVALDIRTIQNELLVDILEFFILTPLPGSELHRSLVSEGVELESDLNMYDLNHVTMAHPTMSKEELNRLYWAVWDMYYSPQHIKTLMQRALVSDINPKRIQHAVNRFYGAISIENVHPLQAGDHRRRDYSQKRPGGRYPNQLAFGLQSVARRFIKVRQRQRLFRMTQRILEEVTQDPASKGYSDQALAETPKLAPYLTMGTRASQKAV